MGNAMRAIYRSFGIINVLVFVVTTLLYIVLSIGINKLFGTPGRYVTNYVFFYFAALLGVYAFHGFEYAKPPEINRIIVSTAAGIILAALVTIPFMILFKPHLTKTAFTVLVAATFAVGVISRMVGAYCFKKLVPARDVVVVGDENRWKPVIDEINISLRGKMRVCSWVNPTPERLMEIAKDRGHTSVIVADPRYYSSEPIKKALAKLADEGCQVEMLPKIVEETLGRVPLEVAQAFKSYYEMAFQMVSSDPRQRAADVILSLFGIIIGIPIAIVVALAIFLDSGRPILYKQERVGKDGEIFTIRKFRTMTDRKDNEAGFADDHACHITRVGKVLRKTRLDEIPQLWDVLRAKMSMVGPRPEQPAFEKQFAEEIPFYRYRRLVKPGITGWAQTKYPYAASVEETRKKLEYDLYYVKNQSLTLYLQIILWTVETMLTMRGAR
jgi:exopolysaccharide biosynthesis polyprenyl glycosylphosphotransferase